MEVAEEACSKEGRFKSSCATSSSYGECWGKSQDKQEAHSTGGIRRLLKTGGKCGARFPVRQNEKIFLGTQTDSA